MVAADAGPMQIQSREEVSLRCADGHGKRRFAQKRPRNICDPYLVDFDKS